MTVLVVGAESSGTKLTSELLVRAGLDVIHRSFPYGGGPRPEVFDWPVIMGFSGVQHVVVVTRDPHACALSQIENGHVNTVYQALYNIAHAYKRIWVQVDSMQVNVFSCPFEALVLHPEVIYHICEWMGHSYTEIKDLEELVKDANAKYYGGPSYGDRRPIEDRLNGKEKEKVREVRREET